MMNRLFMFSRFYNNLYYKNVYAFYEEPLMFSLENHDGDLFFGYALGSEDETSVYLIVPVTQDILDRLENKTLSILGLFEETSDQTLDKLTVFVPCLSDFDTSERQVYFHKLNYLMPEDSIFIDECYPYDPNA